MGEEAGDGSDEGDGVSILGWGVCVYVGGGGGGWGGGGCGGGGGGGGGGGKGGVC